MKPHIEPMSSGVAVALMFVGLPVILIGGLIGLLWQWFYLGWCWGWYIQERMEAFITSRKSKPPSGRGDT